jgi:hypothetical protein
VDAAKKLQKVQSPADLLFGHLPISPPALGLYSSTKSNKNHPPPTVRIWSRPSSVVDTPILALKLELDINKRGGAINGKNKHGHFFNGHTHKTFEN